MLMRATHTIGTVISPGTILMTLVPKDEILKAEVWVDNTQQGTGQSAPPSAKSPNGQAFAYRALIDLKAQELIADGVRHALSPGMQVTAEIHLGARTIL